MFNTRPYNVWGEKPHLGAYAWFHATNTTYPVEHTHIFRPEDKIQGSTLIAWAYPPEGPEWKTI